MTFNQKGIKEKQKLFKNKKSDNNLIYNNNRLNTKNYLIDGLSTCEYKILKNINIKIEIYLEL